MLILYKLPFLDIEISTFTGFSSTVTSACYDYTEQYIFAGSLDRTAKLWDLKNSKLISSFIGHINYINAVASGNTSQKGYTVSTDRSIREWDFSERKLIKVYNSSSGIWSICLSSNDNNFYTGHLDGSFKIWSTNRNDKPEQIIELHNDKIISIKQARSEYQFLTLST